MTATSQSVLPPPFKRSPPFLVSLCVLQLSRIGSDDTYLLPDLLQKTSSSSSPTHNALGHQQPPRDLNYSQSPMTPRFLTHQELHVSLSSSGVKIKLFGTNQLLKHFAWKLSIFIMLRIVSWIT